MRNPLVNYFLQILNDIEMMGRVEGDNLHVPCSLLVLEISVKFQCSLIITEEVTDTSFCAAS